MLTFIFKKRDFPRFFIHIHNLLLHEEVTKPNGVGQVSKIN